MTDHYLASLFLYTCLSDYTPLFPVLAKENVFWAFLSKTFAIWCLIAIWNFLFRVTQNDTEHSLTGWKKIAQDLKMISKGPNGNLQYIYFLVSFFFDGENRSRLSLIFLFGSRFLVLSDVFFFVFLSPYFAFSFSVFVFSFLFTLYFFFSYCHHFLLLHSEFSDKDLSAFIQKIAQQKAGG